MICMRGKRGWIRILEATVAVLIVSGAILAVYSERSVERRVTAAEFFRDLQKEILDDISLDVDLRMAVLNENYTMLNSFVEGDMPNELGYLIRICDIDEICKMDDDTFIATMDKDIFVEEVVISSEIGDGTNPIYSPKKVKFFAWEK